MKIKIILICAVLLNIGVVLAQSEKPVDSKISGVTVFLSRAQVTREVKTRLEAGKTTLVVTGLTASMDTESIQASGKGSFIILGVSQRQNYLNEHNMPKSLKTLRDSLDYHQKQLALETSQKEILNKEEQMLLANQRIGGNNQNISVAELKGMADFYRARLGEIVSSRMKQDEKIKKINIRIGKLNQQIGEQNELYSRNTGEILINVSAEAATQADIELKYIVTQAGWTPAYDLRAVNTKSPVTIGYKANVFQGTGEEWKSVKLKLSTANPTQSGQKPELYTWYLDFYQRPRPYALNKKATGAVMRSAGPEKEDADLQEELKIQAAPAESSADYVSAVQTAVNTEFDISLPYTINSSSKPTTVDIQNYQMNAFYEYAVAPKLDTEAFLIARGTGWEEFNLLPGEANIFFEGTFVGKSFIDPNNIKDTSSVSLGRDKRIVVKREKLKDLTSRKTIGSNQRESYTWEISIRNTRTEAVKIVVEDQLPVSQNTQIEVTPGDLGGGKYNSTTGKLVWNMELQANETKKVKYSFEVKYPKGQQVNGL
ncbi:MAG TPA: DUF4139 domain-containing protein [Cyclobacteriaceae bacterium]|nr:DUF4139 domain-containing protein [Cyclobacteriaceae bacterium]